MFADECSTIVPVSSADVRVVMTVHTLQDVVLLIVDGQAHRHDASPFERARMSNCQDLWIGVSCDVLLAS
jgi:hypothetical protein